MDHTVALISRSHQGDEGARAQLVRENEGLVWCVVKRFKNRGAEAEDLFQIGNIGLLKAIDKFDLTFGVKFSTYAVPMISGEIKRFLRDDGLLKVSRLTGDLILVGRIAGELGVEQEELAMALEAGGEVESLQKPIFQKDGQEIRLMDKLPQEESGEEKMLDHMLLDQLLSELGSQERRLIYLRYFAEQTQSQVGEELGISQVQVSRLEKKILRQMREKI